MNMLSCIQDRGVQVLLWHAISTLKHTLRCTLNIPREYAVDLWPFILDSGGGRGQFVLSFPSDVILTRPNGILLAPIEPETVAISRRLNIKIDSIVVL